MRDPRDDGVGFTGVLHVAHGEAEGVEIVLDAQELKGIAAIAVDEFALEFAEAGKLDGDVGGIGENRENGDDEAKVEALRGSFLRGKRVLHWKQDIT